MCGWWRWTAAAGGGAEPGHPREMELRQVRVLLNEPTQDGHTEILLLTNVPAGDGDALLLSQLYLKHGPSRTGSRR